MFIVVFTFMLFLLLRVVVVSAKHRSPETDGGHFWIIVVRIGDYVSAHICFNSELLAVAVVVKG